jgi:hypothetical protein
VLVGIAILVLAAVDLTRPPEGQIGTRLAIVSLRCYRSTLSRLYDRENIRCRYTPSCSVYAERVVRTHGWAGGGWLALRRVLSCGPWVEQGTSDPPPLAPQAATP